MAKTKERNPCVNFTPFDPELKKKFKQEAAGQGINMSQLAEQVIRQYLTPPKPPAKRQKAIA